MGYNIEGGAFKFVSSLSKWLAFIYVLMVFVFRISYLEKYRTQKWQFIIGITWEDPNGDPYSFER